MNSIPKRRKFPDSHQGEIPQRQRTVGGSPMRDRWRTIRAKRKPCDKWTRGPSFNDEACSEACCHFEGCIDEAAVRFLSVLDDIGRVLFDRYDIKNPSPSSDEWFESKMFHPNSDGVSAIQDLRDKIADSLNGWIVGQQGQDDVDYGLKMLRPSTLATLRAIFPDYKSFQEVKKDRVHLTDIGRLFAEDPDRLLHHIRIPYWFLDTELKRLKGEGATNALKVFLYLVRRATFMPTSPNHGKCWIDYQTIATQTGIGSTKGVQRGVVKLKKLGWIMLIQDKRREGGSVVTVNCFVVKFFKEWKNIKGKLQKM